MNESKIAYLIIPDKGLDVVEGYYILKGEPIKIQKKDLQKFADDHGNQGITVRYRFKEEAPF